MLDPQMLDPQMLGPQMLGPQMQGPQMQGPQMQGPQMLGPQTLARVRPRTPLPERSTSDCTRFAEAVSFSSRDLSFRPERYTSPEPESSLLTQRHRGQPRHSS
jgi:hypothetical protein